MPTNPAVTQTTQFAVETTYGTNVAASKRFTGLGVDFSPAAAFQVFQAMGVKVPTLTARHKKWTAGRFSGPLTYTEPLWIWACCLAAPGAPATVGTNGKKWTIKPSAYDVDAPKSMSMEKGNSVYAYEASGIKVPEWQLVLTRDSSEFSGSLLGALYATGITMTASPTNVPLVPVLSDQIDVFLDATFGNIGTSKLATARRVEIKQNPKLRDNWNLNTSNPSVADIIDIPTSLESTVRVNCDASAFNAYEALIGATQFLRVQAVGPDMAGETEPYELTIDMPVQIRDVLALTNDNDVYAADLMFTAVPDASLGSFVEINLTNLITAL